MKRIGFSSPLKSPGIRRMLDALGEVLEVRFEERTFGDDRGIDAWVLLEVDQETLNQIAVCGLPCYSVIRADQNVPRGRSSAIEFTRHVAVPSLLQGREVVSDEVANLMALPHWLKNVEALALKEGYPVWAMQNIKGHHHYYVAFPFPELNEGEPLFQFFCEEQFLQLLPFILFSRTLTDHHLWKQPSFQACLMFDDPNLHWRTYGFIDFAQIASHAKDHNYHACFATIPLDAWFIHRPTASLFKQYREQLSLLIHGNDHVTQELAKRFSGEGQKRNLRQALGRIEEFVRRSGVEVSRVMAPPHGACSEDTLAEMAQLGFEAACISRGSLRHYNSHADWLLTLGMKPADIIAGLTILPRFRISGTCQNSILISALLGQPIVPVGHHNDIAEGLQMLADVSGFINSLGSVNWTDMRGISRALYARKLDGRTLCLRMYTKRIEINVPGGVTEIRVELPWHQSMESAPLSWRALSPGSDWKLQRTDVSIMVLPGQTIEICAAPSTSAFTDAMKGRNFHLWPFVRRQLTEARDRLAPVFRRLSTS